MRCTVSHAQRMQHAKWGHSTRASRRRRHASTSMAHLRKRRAIVAAPPISLAACVPAPQAAASSPSQPAAATFFVPRPTEEPAAQTTLTGTSFSHPDIERELKNYFELFYKARTLPRGGQFDPSALRALVEGPYADYTMTLFDRDLADAKAGRLLEVSFTDLAVALEFWNQTDTAEANVTRTRVEIRAGGTPTRDTATYLFNLHRHRVGADGVSWATYDFLDPATREWISVEETITDAKATSELTAFFNDFYAARSLAPGQPLDLNRSGPLVAGSYSAYTMPLLERTKAEAESGALKEVRYGEISLKLQSWDPKATDHGGLATVQGPPTAYVTRATGAEAPQLATYQFRVHRHLYDAKPNWLAGDFLSADLRRWVTDIAGATVIVPPAGHG